MENASFATNAARNAPAPARNCRREIPVDVIIKPTFRVAGISTAIVIDAGAALPRCRLGGICIQSVRSSYLPHS
jgi:hypothetical protein